MKCFCVPLHIRQYIHQPTLVNGFCAEPLGLGEYISSSKGECGRTDGAFYAALQAVFSLKVFGLVLCVLPVFSLSFIVTCGGLV